MNQFSLGISPTPGSIIMIDNPIVVHHRYTKKFIADKEYTEFRIAYPVSIVGYQTYHNGGLFVVIAAGLNTRDSDHVIEVLTPKGIGVMFATDHTARKTMIYEVILTGYQTA